MISAIKFCLKNFICLVVGAALGTGAAAQTTTYYHNDVSGSPLLATDASGNVVWKESYRPYGEKQYKQPASGANKIGFHGKAFDDATGLSFMGARYYDPVVGRFMGIDPEEVNVADVHNFNRYTYANNNPYKYVDPDGRAVALAAVGIGILAVAASIHYAAQTPQRQEQMRAALSQLVDKVLSVGNQKGRQGEQAEAPATAVGGSGPAPNDGANNESGKRSNQQSGLGTSAPDDAPSGTLGLDKAGKKYGWDKDTTHGIKDEATGGVSNGRTWVGVAPDGTVGVNEGGKWSPQTSVDLRPEKKQ